MKVVYMKKNILALAVVAGLVSFAGYTKADVNLVGQGDGNTVTATEQFPSSGFAPVSNLVGTNGMLDLSPEGFLTLSSITDPNSNYTATWAQLNSTAAPGWILFTFSNNISLSGIAIWNNPFMIIRDCPSGSFTYSTGNDASGIGNQLWSGNLTPSADGSTVGAPLSDLLSFSTVDDVKALLFNYNASSSDYTIMDKVAFVGTTSVPEPTTYALFGLGAVGLRMAMRRKKTA